MHEHRHEHEHDHNHEHEMDPGTSDFDDLGSSSGLKMGRVCKQRERSKRFPTPPVHAFFIVMPTFFFAHCERSVNRATRVPFVSRLPRWLRRPPLEMTRCNPHPVTLLLAVFVNPPAGLAPLRQGRWCVAGHS